MRIQSDYNRYKSEGIKGGVNVFLQQGIWALVQYRLARYVYERDVPGLSRLALKFLLLWQKLVEVTTGICLPHTSEIGEALFIPHFGSVMLNGKAKIGSFCTIHPGVIIGAAGRGSNYGCPTIGDRVFIGAGAIVIGKISIGNDAVIGAGAVVTKSFPDRAIVVGNPGRMISEEGSGEWIHL